MRARLFAKDQRLRSARDGLAARTSARSWARSRAPSVAIAAAVGVAYFLAAELSNSFLITPETVIFWPAAGISAGALISLWTRARWPVLAGVMVATATANLLRHFSVTITATWVVGNTAEPLIIALLMEHYFGANFKIDRLYCVLALFAAAIVGAAAAATWWTFAYYWLFASLKAPAATWSHWIVSDLAGIVSVAPLVIGLAAAPRRPRLHREAIEGLGVLAVLVVASAVIVSLPLELWNTVVPAALVFPILLWLAARWPPVFGAAGAFIVSMTVALTAIYGLGHFGDSGLSGGARVLQAQMVILVVAFGTTVLAALFAERRESEASLARSNALLERERDNKLMTLRAAIASISHEIKQPLQAIAFYGGAAGGFLKSAPPNLEQAQSALNNVINDSQRTGEILDNLRRLFGEREQVKEPTDVNQLVVSALRFLRGELAGHDVTVAVDLASGLPLVMGSAVQLQEVVVNLAQNAIDAMAPVDAARRAIKVKTELDGNRAILIEIEDSGPGIDPQRLNGMFDAFVTTKSKGMGLGLAICRTIIERHGGKITAAPDRTSGALFRILLPIDGAADHHE
jgi:signal transduction histidine kinase